MRDKPTPGRGSRRIWVVLTLTVGLIGADSPTPPRSAAALKAERQYASAMEKIRQDTLTADRKRIADLDAALKSAVNARDLKEAESIDALKDAAQVQMQEHLSGSSGPSLKIVGEWQVAYLGGGSRTYVVDKLGNVSLPAEGRTGRLKNGIVDLGDGKLERWTPVRDMILVEHFNPAKNFPNGPRQLAVAMRAP